MMVWVARAWWVSTTNSRILLDRLNKEKEKEKNYMIKRVVSHFVPQLLPNLFILFDFFSRLILRNLIFLMIKY